MLFWTNPGYNTPQNSSSTAICLPSHKPSKQDEQDTYYRRSKNELMKNIFLWTSIHRHTSVGQPAEMYMLQFCADTECHLDDLPKVMDDRDR